MEQTFNKTFFVDTYDVAEIKKNWRIVYFPEQKEMMVVKSQDKADLALIMEFPQKEGYVLTKRQAPRSYPKVFFDSSIQKRELDQRTVIVKVSNEQYDFLARFGNVSAYLRQLIDNQMKHDK